MNIEKKVSLHDKCWFETGGVATCYCEPTTERDFVNALLFARDNNQEIFVLGKGANILISDTGFDGLVIRPALKTITFDEKAQTVTAGAGVEIQTLIDACLDACYTGLEDFSAIPGTMGGAVYINIHYFKHLLGNFVVSARVIEKKTGTIIDVPADWFAFGYDSSTLIKKDYFLVSVTLKVKKETEIAAAYAKGRRDEIIKHRHQRYPYKNTCGSFFRNFHHEELTGTNKLPYAGYYLEKIGVKGELKIGSAAVSYQHANMLVTTTPGMSDDVVTLARRMQELVYKEFGLLLVPECQFVGFKEFPLHTPKTI